VIGAIADNASAYAAFTLAPADASILTVEYKLSLLSPGDGEALVARGRVVKPGRTLVVCRSDVMAINVGQEKLVATALVTLMLLVGRDDAPMAPPA
jgi:acyl-coenzyme A thioesterase PaaI-like protein